MASDYLIQLHNRIEEEIDGLQVTEDGLEALLDVRYGEVPVLIEDNEGSDSVRIGATVPSPAGAGRGFLLWLLALNTQYWDLKVGLDDEGRLLFHSDVDVLPEGDPEAFAAMVLERVESVLDLLDDDLIGYLVDHGLGTPAQQLRWGDEGDNDDEENEAVDV